MRVEFERIEADMSVENASAQYARLINLDRTSDGEIDPTDEGSVDAVVVGELLAERPAPTRAQVREMWKRQNLRFAGTSKRDMAKIYALTLEPGYVPPDPFAEVGMRDAAGNIRP
jgi:hypothetical protein